MSSNRVGFGYGLPTRPNEGLRKKPVDNNKKESETPRPGIPRAVTASKLPSRIPQDLSAQRPTMTYSSSLPLPDRQSRSWGSGSTAVSDSSRFHTQTESGSSSSVTSYDSNFRSQNVLRRKKPSIARDASISVRDNGAPNFSQPFSQALHYPAPEVQSGLGLERSLTQSPTEMSSVHSAKLTRELEHSAPIYPELDRYRHVQRPSMSDDEQSFNVPFRLTTDLLPLTPASLPFSGSSSSQLSMSPSNKIFDSPGTGIGNGPYSRDTTPTSISSQSPILASSSRFGKARQHSPALSRPPVTRRRAGSIPNDASASVDPQGLAAVRESLTSSSSSSTVRDGEKNGKRREKKPERLPPPPPSPPPRKSSQKFGVVHERDNSRPSTRGSDHTERVPAIPSPSVAYPAHQRQIGSPSKEEPPPRPSRDGTPDMHQLFGRTPVVQSNIPLKYFSNERRGSEPTIPSVPSKASVTPSLPLKNASTSNLPGLQTEDLKSGPSGGKKSLEASSASRPPQTPSPKVGSSRFNFFSRKKNSSALKDNEKAASKNAPRKGPVAGTGHEGYGKLGATRRRSVTNPRFGNMQPMQSSQESLISDDSFLADRMNPVVIAGGGLTDNQFSSLETLKPEMNQHSAVRRPSTDSRPGSERSTTSPHDAGVTAWPSERTLTNNIVKKTCAASDSSDSEGITMKSTLAMRRSQQRLRSSPDTQPNLPQPINTRGIGASPMTSFDTSVMSDDSWNDIRREPVMPRDEAHPAPKKLVKKDRSPRRWNIFGRSQTQAPTKMEEKRRVTGTAHIEKKPVPYYAMIDPSEQSDIGVLDIREVLRHAEVYTSEASSVRTTHAPSISRPFGRQADRSGSLDEMVSPRSTAFNIDSHASQKATQIPSEELRPGRPSRLPQVGRIPKVMNNRPQHVSPKSFSRPFNRTSQAQRPQVKIFDQQSIAKGPSSEEDVDEQTAHAEPPVKHNDTLPEPQVAPPSLQLSTGLASQEQKEFLSFSPRKDSESTVGASSSSSGVHVFLGATARIPEPSDPPVEDEIWDEYNDLIENDLVQPVSATSSRGLPFHLDTRPARISKEAPMESPTLRPDSKKFSTISKVTNSTTYSADMTERIRKAFQLHDSPATEFSTTGFALVPNWGQQSLGPDANLPVASASRRSSISPCRTDSSDSGSSSFDEAQPLAQVNLRAGSMTVSKWLTFGHVLFSDVRHDLESLKESLQRPSVLIIDGLGNDDWSFYAAETYPKAEFYNLSPRAPLSTELQNVAGFPMSPRNHHQVQFLSHLGKFPFGANVFTALVYRFPSAAPESHYRNILTEASRVLKPGGYLELSILDADLNNMGNVGRRTVRTLKERLHDEMRDTSLASTADLLVRILGQVGFVGVKAARVGVPVASLANRSDKGEGKLRAAEERRKRREDPPSLAEMMSKEGATADEGITKMVARVGRWWYTRCYENSESVAVQKSIWTNRSLLQECEDLGTSLKLTVCCARAPDGITNQF